MSFTAFLLIVVLGGGVALMLFANVVLPLLQGLATLLRALLFSPGGWALIALGVVVALLASSGFLNALL